MSTSPSAITVFANIILLLLPGTAYLAIYLAYLCTREYRRKEIQRLSLSVSLPPDDAKALLSEVNFLYKFKHYAFPLLTTYVITLVATFIALSKAKMPLGLDTVQNIFTSVPLTVLAGVAGSYVANLITLADHARDGSLSAADIQAA